MKRFHAFLSWLGIPKHLFNDYKVLLLTSVPTRIETQCSGSPSLQNCLRVLSRIQNNQRQARISFEKTRKSFSHERLEISVRWKTMFDTQGAANACQEARGQGAKQVSSEAARADDEAGGGGEEEEGGQGGSKHRHGHRHLRLIICMISFIIVKIKVDDLSLMLKRDGDGTIPRRSHHFII